MAKTFVWNKVKELGTIDGNNGCYKSVELGHYTIDGQEKADKVYVFDHFYNRDGSMGSKSVASFTLDEFKALKEMEL